MGGNGADSGHRKHLNIRSKTTTEPTRSETVITIMRVVPSFTVGIPCTEFVDYWPRSEREGSESQWTGVGAMSLKGVLMGIGHGVNRKADEKQRSGR